MALKARTTSIKRNLVNSISVVFAIIIFGIYLFIDLSLDSWMDHQFDKSLLNKANYMKSLVKVSNDRLSFDDAMLSEIQDNDDRHYYQLWFKDHSFKRSASLSPYPDTNLLNVSLPLNTHQFVDVILPNGEEGRAFLSYFLPESEQLSSTHEHPAYLALYQSTHSLERMLVLLDMLLVVTFFLSILVMRYIAIRIVDKGLQPLLVMNDSIKHIDIAQNTTAEIPEPEQKVEEIEPIRKELNAFIKANQLFLQNEQRLTGDIAHELKTPIAEIMSLSEVYIRYPNDERIGQTYKQDMLKIAQRMKTIVDNLLLLQRTSSSMLVIEHNVIDLPQLVEEVIDDLSFKFAKAQARILIEMDVTQVIGDAFSLQTILTNLLDNALFYSPSDSMVRVSVELQPTGLVVAVANQVAVALTDKDMTHLLEPLYQADLSRTSNDRYGLGLSIVNNLCRLNHYQLDVNYEVESQQIYFSIQPLKVLETA